MSTHHRERSIRRILVAMDTSVHSTAALEASATRPAGTGGRVGSL